MATMQSDLSVFDTDETVDTPVRPHGVQLRARRSNRLIVLGVLCVTIGALIMAWVWANTQESQTVVVMVADVARGEQIESSDLGTTTLGRAEGVLVVPSEQVSSMVGQYALVDLPAGSLPGPNSVGDRVIPQGNARLGLRLSAGRIPTEPLMPGTSVWVIAIPTSADDTAEPGKQYEATVVSVPQLASDGTNWLVDIEVDDQVAQQVAILAALDQIVLVWRGEV